MFDPSFLVGSERSVEWVGAANTTLAAQSKQSTKFCNAAFISFELPDKSIPVYAVLQSHKYVKCMNLRVFVSDFYHIKSPDLLTEAWFTQGYFYITN